MRAKRRNLLGTGGHFALVSLAIAACVGASETGDVGGGGAAGDGASSQVSPTGANGGSSASEPGNGSGEGGATAGSQAASGASGTAGGNGEAGGANPAAGTGGSVGTGGTSGSGVGGSETTGGSGPGGASSQCGENEFQCGNGMCIAATLRCDGLTFDCSDQSDELNCATVTTGGSAGTGGAGSGGAGGAGAAGGVAATGGAAGVVNQGGIPGGGGAAGLVGAGGVTGGASGSTGSSGSSGAGGVPGTGGAPAVMRVQYYVTNTDPADAVIQFNLQIGNASAEDVPYSELAIRYYYSMEHAGPEAYWNYYSVIGSDYIVGTYYDNPAPVAGAERYLEITFTEAAGTLAAHSASGEMQNRISHSSQQSTYVYDETDDYSYNPELTQDTTGFEDWDRITMYRDGVLVWGIEPAAA